MHLCSHGCRSSCFHFVLTVPNACVLMDLYADVKHQNPSDPLTTTDLSLAYHGKYILATVHDSSIVHQLAYIHCIYILTDCGYIVVI